MLEEQHIQWTEAWVQSPITPGELPLGRRRDLRKNTASNENTANGTKKSHQNGSGPNNPNKKSWKRTAKHGEEKQVEAHLEKARALLGVFHKTAGET